MLQGRGRRILKGAVTVMNHNVFRWIITAFFLFMLVFLLSCPYIARAEGTKLPMDFLEGGKPPKADALVWFFGRDRMRRQVFSAKTEIKIIAFFVAGSGSI